MVESNPQLLDVAAVTAAAAEIRRLMPTVRHQHGKAVRQPVASRCTADWERPARADCLSGQAFNSRAPLFFLMFYVLFCYAPRWTWHG